MGSVRGGRYLACVTAEAVTRDGSWAWLESVELGEQGRDVVLEQLVLAERSLELATRDRDGLATTCLVGGAACFAQTARLEQRDLTVEAMRALDDLVELCGGSLGASDGSAR